MICFTLVLYFKLKFDLIYITYKISYICFYIIKAHETNSFTSRSFDSCIFFTVAPIRVLFHVCVFVARRRFVLQTFHLDFMFGVLF